MTSLRALIDQATPGPWEMDTTFPSASRWPRIRPVGAEQGIASVGMGQNANARLIAAAPTMADLLDRAMTELREWHDWAKLEQVPQIIVGKTPDLLAEFAVLLASLQPGEPA